MVLHGVLDWALWALALAIAAVVVIYEVFQLWWIRRENKKAARAHEEEAYLDALYNYSPDE